MTDTEQKIIDRARLIVKAHKDYPHLRIIQKSGNEKWLIRSQTLDVLHFIIHDYDEGWSCNCAYFLYKGTCKHIKTIQFILEENIFIPEYKEISGTDDVT